MPTSQAKARRRRSSEEVRSLVLEAARELFAEEGFGGATTRAIADRAGVTETILFRNFGTKERIFELAVVEPVGEFLSSYSRRWTELPLAEGDPDEMLRNFVEALYDLGRENRTLLLAARPEGLSSEVRDPLRQLQRMAAETAKLHGYTYDAPVAIRAAVAMVLAVAVFEEPLFGGRSAGRQRIVDELTGILTRGLERRD